MWASSLEKAIAHPAVPGDPAGIPRWVMTILAAAEGFELDPASVVVGWPSGMPVSAGRSKGEFVDSSGAVGEAGQDRPPGRAGRGGEGLAQPVLVDRHRHANPRTFSISCRAAEIGAVVEGVVSLPGDHADHLVRRTRPSGGSHRGGPPVCKRRDVQPCIPIEQWPRISTMR